MLCSSLKQHNNPEGWGGLRLAVGHQSSCHLHVAACIGPMTSIWHCTSERPTLGPARMLAQAARSRSLPEVDNGRSAPARPRGERKTTAVHVRVPDPPVAEEWLSRRLDGSAPTASRRKWYRYEPSAPGRSRKEAPSSSAPGWGKARPPTQLAARGRRDRDNVTPRDRPLPRRRARPGRHRGGHSGRGSSAWSVRPPTPSALQAVWGASHRGHPTSVIERRDPEQVSAIALSKTTLSMVSKPICHSPGLRGTFYSRLDRTSMHPALEPAPPCIGTRSR